MSQLCARPIAAAPAPERDEVVLVDAAGNPVGRADRVAVHGRHTPLHLAFSTYLFNDRGEILLTRRALSKRTWPGVWTNSCCGHPRPGEALEAAARRRIREELGLRVGPLVSLVPDFAYRAEDASGVVENERCPVLGAFDVEGSPVADPAEVVEWAWASWEGFVAAVAATPRAYSPWAVAQVPLVDAVLRSGGPDAAGAADAGVAGVLRDVDALLGAELAAVAREWVDATGPLGCDVLAADLPRWLEDLLVGQGKRLRVRMAYWGFVAAGGRHGTVAYRHLVRVAAAVESLHLFALVHDDVMDASPMRRGRPSAHTEAAAWHRAARARGDAERFGVNLAVLLGDLAHVVADRLADDLPSRLRRLWYAMWVELIAGQRADLTGAAARRRDLAHTERVAQLKSGRYTVTRPLQLGATVAGADAAQLEALSAFGDHVGCAFALRDDLLGIWGDPAVTGKPATSDLREGKATVPLALAAERLRGDEGALLDRVGSPDLSGPDVAAIADAMRAAGIDGEVESRIAAAVAAGLAALGDVPLAPAGLAGLTETAHAVAWRQS